MLSFKLVKTCPQTGARAGLLNTPHGEVPTPAFIPLASQGTVRTLTPQELKALGARLVLGNTYHLYLRPGAEVIRKLGGLHRFMGWDGPLITDSGGYQVFSLAHLSRVDEEGVLFRSHIDGSEHLFTPELAIRVQEGLGADIILALDECPSYSPDKEAQRGALGRTLRWAERCLHAKRWEDQALFAIVQGGIFPDLRREGAAALSSLDFPGYAIGGLSVGEPKEVMWPVVEATVSALPQEKPRYLMGVGSPEDLMEGVARGVDLFDCALPTRIARNGSLLTRRGRLNIRNSRFRNDPGPPDPSCSCYTCTTFSAAYLHHLFREEELLAYRLATIHNLSITLNLVAEIREAIIRGGFPAFRESFRAGYQPTDQDTRLSQKERWLKAQRRRGELPSRGD